MLNVDPGLSVVIGALIGVIGYIVKAHLDRQKTIFDKKEERYIGMLKSIQGFYVGGDPQLKKKFIEELNLAYLYASDEVIQAINKFLNTVKVKKRKSPDKAKKEALISIIIAMRRDLKGKTSLNVKNFETWIST